jgi:hypothetical protein
MKNTAPSMTLDQKMSGNRHISCPKERIETQFKAKANAQNNKFTNYLSEAQLSTVLKLSS